MESNPTTTATNQGQPPGAAPAPKARIRGVFIVIWGIASAFLLAEYVFTTFDLDHARKAAWALSASIGDDDLERPEGSEARSAALETRIADLTARVDAKDGEIARLKADLARSESKARDAGQDARPAGAGNPSLDRASGLRGPSGWDRTADPAGELFASESGADAAAGRIILREAGSEFAAIDLGARDGIRKGMKLSLKAAGQEVGTFLVVDARTSVSVGRIVAAKGETVDDEVRVEK